MQNQRELEMLSSFCGTGVQAVQKTVVLCPMAKGQAEVLLEAIDCFSLM